MAREKMKLMVLDSETATLPFANVLANGDEDRKKRIAISRPLAYDIAWSIILRDGTILEQKQYLVSEIFCVPAVFNTAYYAEKRPRYLEMIERGEIEVKTWKEITEELVKDLERVDYVGAFNSMFDFKKAIPFTELYIQKLYSPDYYDWEKMQYAMCERIADNVVSNKPDRDFDGEHFTFRGKDYDMFDIWGMACEHLLNRVSYKEMCLDHNMLTNSGEFFKSSAESSYRYLQKKYDFEEAHTALADTEIESAILAKILRNHGIKVGIEYFPFRKLGTTDDFVLNHCRRKQAERAEVVYNAMADYLGEDEVVTQYQKHIASRMEALMEVMEG